MSYHESVLTCDWCVKDIYNSKSVACGKCMAELEDQISVLEKEIARLKEERDGE